MIRALLAILDARGRARLRRVLAGFGLAAVAQGVAFALIVPVLSALFAGDWTGAWRWLAVLAAVLIVHHVLLVLSAVDGYGLSSDLLRTLLHRIGDHVARLPLGWFGPGRTGPLTRMAGRGAVDISAGPAHLLRPLTATVLTPATVVVAMLALRWQLGVALLAGIAATLLAMRVLSRAVDRSEAGYESGIAEATSRVIEFAASQPALRVFGRTTSGNRLVEAALDAQARGSRQIVVTGFASMSVVLVVVQAVLTVVTVLAVDLTLTGSAAPATMIALLVLAVRFVEPLVNAGELTGTLRLSRAALTRVTELLDTPLLPEPGTPAEPADASVELRDVTFGYEPGTPVLRGVSLTARPRSLTAVVGPSGAGKSTLLRLIARFYDLPGGPAAGAVLVGGRDVRTLGTERLMRQLSLVFQDVYLFEGTLRDNVLMSRPGATEADLARAARLARVDEIVNRLPHGWDTRVGEAGSTLSGGEKQRISIARALLKDAPIVLLDEATAALDALNEAAVQQALTALAADRTVIVVAHRLPTVVAADQILVLDDGQVTESGTHAELLAAGGRYAQFWAERSQAAGWRLVSSG